MQGERDPTAPDERPPATDEGPPATDESAARRACPSPVERATSRCAAVVVNHDAGTALLGCVASLRAAGIGEIVVVDNSSSDGSLERLARADHGVVLVPTGRNLGYGRAANVGVQRTRADYVLICNPDLVVAPDSVEILARLLEDEPDCAMAGPRLENPDGSRYPSARAFPSLAVAAGHALLGQFFPYNPWSRRYRMDARFAGTTGVGPDASRAVEVDWVSGACFLARRRAMSSVSGFDEGYFMYAEDIDLCWRLHRAGWRVLYEQAAQVVHAQGLSTSRQPIRMLVAHHRSTWRFARRSARGPSRLALPVVAGALAGRLVVALARELAHRRRARS